MNMESNSTSLKNNRALNDRETLQGLLALGGLISDLKRAAYVLDELMEFEFDASAAKTDEVFPFHLNKSQVEGLFYMASHVRTLANQIDSGFDRALIGEE